MQQLQPQSEAEWRALREAEVRAQMRCSMREAHYWWRRCLSLEAEVRILRGTLASRGMEYHPGL